MMETAIRRAFDRLLKHSRACTLGVAMACSGAFVLPTAPVAYGQGYETIPYSAEMAQDAGRKAAADAKKSLMTGSSSEFAGDAGQKATQYYTGFVIPAMTNPALAERARKEIFTDIKTAKSQEMRDLIIRSVEGPLKTLVDNEAIAPSSRVAALVLLGELDTEQADFTGNKPPKPNRNTIAFLRTQLKKPNQMDGLLAAALVAMNRQVRYSSPTWTAAAKDAIADDLKSVLNAPKPIARSTEAHAYIQRMVIEQLALFNSSKHPEILNQLVTMLADDKQPTMVRVAICRALPRWALDSLTEDQRKQVLAGSVQLVQAELVAWLEQARDPRKGNTGGMGGRGGMMGPGMMGGEGDGMEGLLGGPTPGGRGGPGGIGAPQGGAAAGSGNKDKNLSETQDLATNAARRKLYTVLESAYLGLDGKAFALDRRPVGKGLDGYFADTDPLVDPTKKVLAEIDALYDALGTKTVTNLSGLSTAMTEPIEKFNELVKTIPGMENYKEVEIKKPEEAEVADGAAAPDGAAPDGTAPAGAPNPGNPDPAGAAAPGDPAAAGAGAPAPGDAGGAAPAGAGAPAPADAGAGAPAGGN